VDDHVREDAVRDVALTRAGISQFPDVDYPNIAISVSWTGASPPAVEREIVRS
jgi:multidrug efflux pump subunit AcrB